MVKNEELQMNDPENDVKVYLKWWDYDQELQIAFIKPFQGGRCMGVVQEDGTVDYPAPNVVGSNEILEGEFPPTISMTGENLKAFKLALMDMMIKTLSR